LAEPLATRVAKKGTEAMEEFVSKTPIDAALGFLCHMVYSYESIQYQSLSERRWIVM
jgi:hypothetical protein